MSAGQGVQVAGNANNNNLTTSGQQQAGQSQPAQNNMSQQNLNQIVIEYLMKKGYTRTEAMLRQESANIDKDGRPITDKAPELLPGRYREAFILLSSWIDGNLDVYKSELRRLLWPVFVYSYLALLTEGSRDEAKAFLSQFTSQFEHIHLEELKTFQAMSLKEHVLENPTASLYRNNRYRLPLNTQAYFTLVTFLEANSKKGGNIVLSLLSTCCEIRETSRGPIDQYSFEQIVKRGRNPQTDDTDDLTEGIAGAFVGAGGNMDTMVNSKPVDLGVLPMDAELDKDVRAELVDHDARNPPQAGQLSLLDTLDQKIKREDSVAPDMVLQLPRPPARARDVVMEVQKIREYRDRFKIEGRTGGIGPAVSVCMFTFHNTLDTVNCIEFSEDDMLVAVGTEESYVRVWHLHGEALQSVVPPGQNQQPPSSSRRLIGHSGPVYSVSFSPAIATPQDAGPSAPSTAPRLLLSSSADKTIRLWSLEAWTCLVVYKGHQGPVWNVRWGPQGHYFSSCSWDKTVRVWSQSQISFLRLMIDHQTSVNQIAWHPNGLYVFSAGDQVDRSVRMWNIINGECVRKFPGHQNFVSALECSSDGKILASADGDGSILLWDILTGTLIKKCRGHGKGGVWSLSFSVESTVLTSGGADGTVRVWDVNMPADPHKSGADGEIIGTGGPADVTRSTGASGIQTGPGGSGSTKKKKDTVVTPDQISAFPTKKSPVYKVKFTRMNLVMAGSCYLA